MKEEKRKLLRFECSLPAKVEKLEGNYSLVEEVTACDFTSDGLKLVINFNINSDINPGSNVKLKLSLPEKKLSTSLSGEITWSKCVDNKLELGLKIKQMDKKLKSDFLNWIFPRWIEREIREKEKK